MSARGDGPSDRGRVPRAVAAGRIQTCKARLQGRRGTSPLQPYRTLARLWRKSRSTRRAPAPSTAWRPALVAACMLVAIAIVPVAGRAGSLGLGSDALVLLGVLAIPRFAMAAASWDSGSGFALMASARDLMIAVFAEALLVLAILLAALPAQSTALPAMSAAAAGAHVWSGPAHWCGALAFALVILVETGRQPIDNPDTHLELTMIHEGPLLEYAGRDLALLLWAAAARHWVFLVLGAELYLPHAAAASRPPSRGSSRARRSVRGARADRDGAGEDADPAGARAAGRRLRARARRSRAVDRGVGA